MLYLINTKKASHVTRTYEVERKTFWKIAEPDNILIIVLKGSCNIEFNNKAYTLKKGDVFFIPKNQIYYRYPIEDLYCTMQYIHFITDEEIIESTPKEISEIINNYKFETDNIVLNNSKFINPEIYKLFLANHIHINDNRLFEIVKYLKKALKTSSITRFPAFDIYLHELVFIISEEISKTVNNLVSESFSVSAPKLLKEAMMYIKQNIAKPITLTDICNYCNVSKSQMIRYFNSEFNKTPTSYILELKINSAKEMFLNSPTMLIETVAEEVGFSDAKYFSRVFKKLTGETPKAYRYRVLTYPTGKPDAN